MIIKYIKRQLLMHAKVKYIYAEWLKGKDFDFIKERNKIKRKYNYKNELNSTEFNTVMYKVQLKINKFYGK